MSDSPTPDYDALLRDLYVERNRARRELERLEREILRLTLRKDPAAGLREIDRIGAVEARDREMEERVRILQDFIRTHPDAS